MEEKQLSEKLVDFFEENPGMVFSKSELVKFFKVNPDKMMKKLKNLIKHHEIGFEWISFRIARKIYGNNNLKRGIRVYFLEN